MMRNILSSCLQDGTITIKNSPGRNLHRLLNTLAFISQIFKGLAANKSLKDAVSDAYDETLGKLHAWVVRTGIKAGMIGLPSREHFLKSIGETEESARIHGDGFIEAADAIVESINSLYSGIEMPKSDFSMKSLW
jgi:subtilase family serine protease